MTVADLKKILDSMPNDAKVIVNVRKVDADWIITDTLVSSKNDGTKVVYLDCNNFAPDDSDA